MLNSKVTICGAILALFFVFVSCQTPTSSAKNLNDLVKEVNATLNANKDLPFNDLKQKLREQTQASIKSLKDANYVPTQSDIDKAIAGFTVASDSSIAKENKIPMFYNGIGRHLSYAFNTKGSNNNNN